MKNIEIETGKSNFKYLYKITDIEIDKVTFVKYEVISTGNILDSTKSTITLGNIEGKEIHICKPYIICELAGKVGMLIKGFEVELIGKSRKKVHVNKIIHLE